MNRSSRSLADILAYIHETFADPMMTIGDASLALHLSERHIRRIVKLYSGTTFTVYVRRLRIGKAKSLLATSTMGVKQISALVGYHDTSWFIRYFHSETGLTPIHFRESSWQRHV